MPQKRENTLSFVLCILDCAVAMLSLYIAGMIRYAGDYNFFNQIVDIPQAMFVTFMVALASFYIVDVFDGFIRRGVLAELWKTAQYNACVLVGMTIFTFSTKNQFALSRMTLVYLIMVNGVLDLAMHALMKIIFRRGLTKRAAQDRRLLLFVSPDEAEGAIKQLQSNPEWRYSLCGVVPLSGSFGAETVQGVPIVASTDEYLAYATANVVDEVLILCAEQKRHAEKIQRIITDFELMGVMVHLQIEMVSTGLPDVKVVGRMGNYPVLTFSNRTYDYRMLVVKRGMDIVGGFIGLLGAILIGIVIAPFLLIESPGPLLFSQKRVGRNGRTFKIYKFRSMYRDAEARKQALMDQNEMKGKIFKIKDDPRITRMGRFIRKTSLDEFPQFWNVLRGDMSLVGTRPPTLEEYAQYTHLDKRRLSFRPGLTGLWQVSGRNDIEDFDEIVRLDVEYIQNWSIRLDVELILKTVLVIFRGRGAS